MVEIVKPLSKGASLFHPTYANMYTVLILTSRSFYSTRIYRCPENSVKFYSPLLFFDYKGISVADSWKTCILNFEHYIFQLDNLFDYSTL